MIIIETQSRPTVLEEATINLSSARWQAIDGAARGAGQGLGGDCR
jgi:hypothetical protein